MDNEEILDERVNVIAVFDKAAICRPIRVKRNNQKIIEVKEIGLYFTKNVGSEIVHVFDLTDNQSDYRLEFHSKTLKWFLTREADKYA
jgi:hypothetical protein